MFEIAQMNIARQLLGMLRDSTNAVALDPVFEEGQHSAEYGFSIDSLLDKYLVHED